MNQQNALFTLMIECNYIVFDMFWTTKRSSSGRLCKQLYGYFIMHLYKQSNQTCCQRL